MTLSSIPLPLRIAGAVIVVLLLLAIASRFHGLITIAAVAAWALALAALLYSSGLVPGAAGLPMVGRFVAAISMPQSQPAIGQTTSRGPAATPPPIDREALARSAEQQLRGL